jgi:hypothetical protein
MIPTEDRGSYLTHSRRRNACKIYNVLVSLPLSLSLSLSQYDLLLIVA